MKGHVHVGLPSFAVTVSYVLIFTVLWRTASGMLADKPVGKAMAAVYS